MPTPQENLAEKKAIQAALEAEKRKNEREDLALDGRTMDAFQAENFQERHFGIVNTIMVDGSNEIENDYPEENLRQIKHVMAKAIEKSSDAFRKFTGENALPVYTTNDNNNNKKTAEYSSVMEITGPIIMEETDFTSSNIAQEILNVAGLEEVDAHELIHKLSFTDLLAYSYKKITGSETEEDLAAVTQEQIKNAIDIVVPEKSRWGDFDDKVIDSINYSEHDPLSDQEKKAMDLLFILMNQLWKVQQVHRAVFEDRVSDEKLDSDEDLGIGARISSERLEYQTYEGYLLDSYNKFKDESTINGLVYAAYGVQKDLMIYLRK